jgi:hypothetical protein
VKGYDRSPVAGVWVLANPGGTGEWSDATGTCTLLLISDSYTLTASKAG